METAKQSLHLYYIAYNMLTISEELLQFRCTGRGMGWGLTAESRQEQR